VDGAAVDGAAVDGGPGMPAVFEAPAVFEVRAISKAFDGIVALEEANFRLNRGEIHALIGENGAGKSTLINIATGVYQPDGGQVLLDDAPLELSGPRSAAAHGIAVVHQERNLVGAFSVAENLFLGNQPRSRGLVSYRRMFGDALPWLKEVGLNVDPSMDARQLSPGQAQLLEIARALSARCRVLFLDEPTSSISETDSEHLFAILRELRDRGTAIVFVSHKLEEVYGLCDRVTVLRDGRNVITGQRLADISRADIVRAMVGREAQAPASASRQGHGHRHGQTGAARLKLENLATQYGHEEVNLTVHAGEIVGLYGLVGAGRTELARCLVGLGRITGGTFSIDGEPAHVRNPYEALRKYSLGYVSEDRKGEGLILGHSISRNVGITIWDRVSGHLGRVSERAVRPAVLRQAENLQLKMNSLAQTVSRLSGGNQQKVSLAKWLAAETEILLLDEPTVGVDVGAKAEVHGLVRGLADQGKAILLISSDLREIVQLADRIVIMGNFRLLGEIENTGDYTSVSKAIMERITGAPSVNPTSLDSEIVRTAISMAKITEFVTHDVRFPTSLRLDGSDAMNPSPDYSAAYLVIRTDEADSAGTGGEPLSGHSFVFTIGPGNDVQLAAIHLLERFLVGRDLDEVLADLGGLYRALTGYSPMRWLGPECGIAHMAVGAVMNACWDLAARRAGKPLWQLLADLSPEELVGLVDFRYLADALTPDEALELLERGQVGKQERAKGLSRDGYPAYSTTPGWLGYSDDRLAELCAQAVQDGFGQVKLKVGARLDDDKRRCAIARETVGESIDIAIDANQVWDVATAIAWIRELAPVRLAWIEEPTSPFDILGFAAIRRAVRPVPVATGEHVANRVIFKQLLQADAIDVMQIDACRVAGVNENLANLLLAAKFGVPVCPHAGGVGLCEAVQHLSMFDYVALTGTMNGRMIEWIDHLHEHFTNPAVVTGGRYQAPSAPGFSTELRPESVAEFSFPAGVAWRGTGVR
jgi:L-fuconate dehydratase